MAPIRKSQPTRKRTPRIKTDEKAATTKAARDLAKEVNGQLAKIKEEALEIAASKKEPLTAEERERIRLDRKRRVERRRKERAKNGTAVPRCMGKNVAGYPCKLAPLVPENWDGDGEISGLYCHWHEPAISRDETDRWELHGTTKKPVPRFVTPSELAYQMMKTAPQHFLRPHFEALGLRLNEDGDLVRVGTGLKLYGYSRGGQVVKSRYPDLVAQANISEKLYDRVFGKPRQALDLAAQVTSQQVHIVMDPERISTVADVLAQAGVFLQQNGNGDSDHSDAIELDPSDVIEE